MVSNDVSYENWIKMSKADQEIITTIFVNLGKSIAAYERTLMPASSRLDQYIGYVFGENKTDPEFTKNEIDGLKLFIGKGMCIMCHNGPLLTTHGFKNLGLPTVKKLGVDQGRFIGIKDLINDKFNCLGKYSDAKKTDCVEMNFIKTLVDESMGAFKIPGLRNVGNTAPYMHSGQFETLSEVLKHYREKPTTIIGHTDLLANDLSDDDLINLEAFLRTL